MKWPPDIGIDPYYYDDYTVIYHGDCRDILPLLPKVDLVLTDPPYGVGYVTAWRSRHDKLREAIYGDDGLRMLRSVLQSLFRKLRQERHWYIFASPRKIAEVNPLLSPYGMKQILVWDKGDRGTVGDLQCGFGEAWEAIVYGCKGRRPLKGPRPRSVIRYDWSGTMDPVHPTVKPVPLLQKMIEWSTNTGELILDPFMGSGTTLRAAKDLQRRAIGIEIKKKYCDVAVQRLRQEVLPL